MRYFINIIIALVITVVVTALVAFVLSMKFERKADGDAAVPVLEVPANTAGAPAEGTVVPMEEIPDETFASGVLGTGVGIRPIKGIVTAPFSGTVTQAADTGHALGHVSEDGLELLIHVGVDAVETQGKGFTPKVKERSATG